MAPKARKKLLTKVRSQRVHFFCISPPPGYLCGPYFKVTARTNNANPAVLFPCQRHKPHLANWGEGETCLDSTFFRYIIARDRRIVPPSQAGVSFGSGVGSHGMFCPMPIPREIKLRQKKGPTSWGVAALRPSLLPTRNPNGQKPNHHDTSQRFCAHQRAQAGLFCAYFHRREDVHWQLGRLQADHGCTKTTLPSFSDVRNT